MQVLEDLRQKMHQFVISELGPILYDQRVSEADLRKQVEEQLHKALSQERHALTGPERQTLVQSVFDDVLGYGPIDRLLRDPTITEIMVNGPQSVYVERKGKIELTDVQFVDDTHVRRIIDKIVSQVGRRVDEATPMVDARLPDGSRVNCIIHPLAIGGPFMTIRRFSADPYTIEDLINFGSVSPQAAHFIDACVRGRLNVVVSGGTGTGKTTMLNVAVVVHPRGRAHRHDRGREGAPAPAAARAAASRPARPTSRARARSRSATWSATPCVCVPTGWSSVSVVAPRPSTCSRP